MGVYRVLGWDCMVWEMLGGSENLNKKDDNIL